MSKSRKIEIHPAYRWDCEECGRENFGRMVTAQLPDEELEKIMRSDGVLDAHQSLADLPPGVKYDLITIPEIVKCGHCGAEFETVDPRRPPTQDDPADNA